MKKNNILITIKKELRSIFRDKKTILMIFCFPFMIAFFVFFFGYMEDSMMGNEDKKSEIGINYDLDSTEKTILAEYNLLPTYYDNLTKMKDAYEEGKIEAYIDYNTEKNTYTVYCNEDITASRAGDYAVSYLETYNRYLGDQYIKGEDIDPEVVYNNFTYELKTTEGEEISANAFIINIVMDMSFTYIIAAIALAAVNMATSAIAVEKENGTLETILTLPVTTTELIVGKYIATVIIGAISSIIGFAITIISFAFARNMFTVYEGFSITAGTIIFGLIICVVASILIGGLAIFITSSSKSYKEAQASGQILSLACLFPMFLSFLDFETTTVYYLVPILNHTTILMDLYSGNINYLNLLITIISTLVYAVALIYFLLKKFKSEKVLFGA